MRAELQNTIEQFERDFFSLGGLHRRQTGAAKTQDQAELISEGDLENVGHLDKKAMRREVRKSGKGEAAQGDAEDASVKQKL